MNMEPVAWMQRTTWMPDGVAIDLNMSGRGEPLYTEAQLNQARADALRDAADEFGKRWTQSAKVQQELRRMADEVAKNKH